MVPKRVSSRPRAISQRVPPKSPNVAGIWRGFIKIENLKLGRGDTFALLALLLGTHF